MGKRKNGDGSWTKKKINGILYHRFRKQYDGIDKPKEFYGKTITEVKTKIKEFEESSQLIVEKDIRKITFYNYISDWLKCQKKIKLKPRVYHDYEVAIESCIKNFIGYDLGSKQMGQLDETVFKCHIDAMSKCYARSSIVKVYAIIRQCLKYAKLKKHISDDFLELYHLPSENNVVKKKKDSVFLNKEDVLKLYRESQKIVTHKGSLDTYKYANNGFVLIFILSTGMRVNECLARKWKDFNESQRTLTISTSLSRVPFEPIDQNYQSSSKGEQKYKTIETTPKTTNSIRIIPLSDMALWAISMLKKQNIEYKPNDFICLNSNGERCKERTLTTTLQSIIKNANCSVEKCNLHALRHTFGSVLLADHVDIKVISELLGHKDVTTTYNIYISLFKEQKISAIQSFQLPNSIQSKS